MRQRRGKTRDKKLTPREQFEQDCRDLRVMFEKNVAPGHIWAPFPAPATSGLPSGWVLRGALEDEEK